MPDFSLKMHQIQFSAGAPPRPLAEFGENGRKGERKGEGKGGVKM